MTKTKPRIIVLRLLAAVMLVLVVYIGSNWYRREHAVFDSKKWQADINCRDEMGCPVELGMTKDAVLKLLGKPDASGTNEKGITSLIYLIPRGSTKGAYFIMVQKNVVVDLAYDDSSEELYESPEK